MSISLSKAQNQWVRKSLYMGLEKKKVFNHCQCGHVLCENEQRAFIFKLCDQCGIIHINAQLLEQSRELFLAEKNRFLAMAQQCSALKGHSNHSQPFSL